MTRTFPKSAQRETGRRAQRGMSMTLLLAIMAVAIFIATFAFKAGPSFSENWTVLKVVDSVTSDEALMRGSRKGVYKQLNTQFGHNNLWSLKAEEIVTLKKEGNTYTAFVNYEKRETLFRNIDLVMRFNNEPTEP